MPQSFDLIVVGGGPGGYVAAIRAAQLKLKVALVEREHLGGICLNWGCIPTKALLRSAEVLELMRHGASFGLACDNPRYDAAAVVKRSRGVAQQLNRGVGHLLKKNKVTVLDGTARLAGKGKLAVTLSKGGEETLEARHIILATGARARQLPGLESDGKLVWSYKEAMVPEKMPKSLLVVGSGAIGIEFASFYRSLGAEVTVVEVLPRVLPVEDEEISAFAHKAFEKRGMKIRTGATVKALKKGADSVTATVESGGKSEELTVERVIMAVGITGNTENLGLEGTGVKVDRGHIVIDQWCRTGEPGVYAIGDVAGPPWLAHTHRCGRPAGQGSGPLPAEAHRVLRREGRTVLLPERRPGEVRRADTERRGTGRAAGPDHRQEAAPPQSRAAVHHLHAPAGSGP